jgi:hypothetical protein
MKEPSVKIQFCPCLQFDLQEGAGANVMSAFVEIIFDNTDGRIPVRQDQA